MSSAIFSNEDLEILNCISLEIGLSLKTTPNAFDEKKTEEMKKQIKVINKTIIISKKQKKLNNWLVKEIENAGNQIDFLEKGEAEKNVIAFWRNRLNVLKEIKEVLK